MLREDSSEVSKDAADRLGPGTELKLLHNSQKYRTCKCEGFSFDRGDLKSIHLVFDILIDNLFAIIH